MAYAPTVADGEPLVDNLTPRIKRLRAQMAADEAQKRLLLDSHLGVAPQIGSQGRADVIHGIRDLRTEQQGYAAGTLPARTPYDAAVQGMQVGGADDMYRRRMSFKANREALTDATAASGIAQAGDYAQMAPRRYAAADIANQAGTQANLTEDAMRPVMVRRGMATAGLTEAQAAGTTAKTGIDLAGEKRTQMSFDQMAPLRAAQVATGTRQTVAEPDVSYDNQLKAAETGARLAQMRQLTNDMSNPNSVPQMQRDLERRKVATEYSGVSPRTIEDANAASQAIESGFMIKPKIYSGSSPGGRIGGEGLSGSAEGASRHVVALEDALTSLENLAATDPEAARMEAMKIHEPPAMDNNEYEAADSLYNPFALGGRGSRSQLADKMTAIKRRLAVLRAPRSQPSPSQMAQMRAGVGGWNGQLLGSPRQ